MNLTTLILGLALQIAPGHEPLPPTPFAPVTTVADPIEVTICTYDKQSGWWAIGADGSIGFSKDSCHAAIEVLYHSAPPLTKWFSGTAIDWKKI